MDDQSMRRRPTPLGAGKPPSDSDDETPPSSNRYTTRQKGKGKARATSTASNASNLSTRSVSTVQSSTRGEVQAQQEDRGQGGVRRFPGGYDDDNVSEAGTVTTVGGGVYEGRSLGLPAVKGTIGGIESPQRQRFPSGMSATPTFRSGTPHGTESGSTYNGAHPHQYRSVFRIDPTIKSCLDTMPLPAKEEIKRLFGLA